VHEKLQNFMVPIPNALWHEQQVNELFSSLLGKSVDQAPASSAAQDTAVAPLRIFG
jgi:protein AATF/BFR2